MGEAEWVGHAASSALPGLISYHFGFWIWQINFTTCEKMVVQILCLYSQPPQASDFT